MLSPECGAGLLINFYSWMCFSCCCHWIFTDIFSVGLGDMDYILLVLSHHNAIGTSVTSLYCHTSCVISFHNHWYCCIYHPATAVIGSSLLLSLLGWVLWTTLHWCCHAITPLELHSIVILAVLFPFTITDIAVFIIQLLLSSDLHWCFLCWVGLGIMDYISLVLSLTP